MVRYVGNKLIIAFRNFF